MHLPFIDPRLIQFEAPAWWPSLVLALGLGLQFLALAVWHSRQQIAAELRLEPVEMIQRTIVKNRPLPLWLPAMTLPVDVPVPKNPNLLPGAPRSYRAGIHQGVDFVGPVGTPVKTAMSGYVLSISNSPDLPEFRRDDVLRLCKKLGATPPSILSVLHGRRIVLVHGWREGRLYLTSYSHLSGIKPDLKLGSEVTQGEIIAWMGNSGTSNNYTSTQQGELHFEIHVDGKPLGLELSPTESHRLYAFALRGRDDSICKD